MAAATLTTGQIVYDPRGVVEVTPRHAAPRLAALDGMRLAVLDNTKWNARKLLERTVAELAGDARFTQAGYYKKESFAKSATPELIGRIAEESDAVLIAIGD